MVYEDDSNRNRTYSDSYHSALQMIAGFWQQVWCRNTACEELERAASKKTTSVSGPPCGRNWIPDAGELYQGVAKMSGIPGIDGWSTEELAALPPAYRQDFCTLFTCW